jgi:hypothetical protein
VARHDDEDQGHLLRVVLALDECGLHSSDAVEGMILKPNVTPSYTQQLLNTSTSKKKGGDMFVNFGNRKVVDISLFRINHRNPSSLQLYPYSPRFVQMQLPDR